MMNRSDAQPRMDMRLRSPTLASMPKGRAIAVMVLTVLPALILLFAGGSKLAGTEMSKEQFDGWDYAQALRPVVGAIEVVLAVLLLVPATRLLGSVLMALWILGAAATHVQAEEWAMIPVPIVVGGLALVAAWLMWDARRPWKSMDLE